MKRPNREEGGVDQLEKRLDHFVLYECSTDDELGETVIGVQGRFDKAPIEDLDASHQLAFATPTRENGSELVNANNHLTLFHARSQETPYDRTVRVTNQFGEATINIHGPKGFIAPAHKLGNETAPPEGIDHFMIYRIVGENKAPGIGGKIELEDQFGKIAATLSDSIYFAVPTSTHDGGETTEVLNPEGNLIIYTVDVDGETAEDREVEIEDLMSRRTLFVASPSGVIVPTLAAEI